ncbi:MAG: methylmalonyl Co-A mutase-associated GTPase MeaB [Sandaracinus sp.]
MTRARDIPTDELASAVARADRTALGRALTLVESRAEADLAPAARLLAALPARTAVRVAFTGAPGAGKSSFLEVLGAHLLATGRRIGVLAVDPSSTRSGGSILGDKTRMSTLARDERAFVRPTPSAGALGGVAPATREGIRVLESAGFDLVVVETVGVGQSEIEVASLVDTLVWITGPSSGDELQGIKRGLVETVDVVVVNKADGDRLAGAEITKSEIQAALRYVPSATEGWPVPVLLASAHERRGIDEVLAAIEAHRAHLVAQGLLEPRRRRQSVEAFHRALERALAASLRARPEITALEARVASGAIGIHAAVAEALRLGR